MKNLVKKEITKIVDKVKDWNKLWWGDKVTYLALLLLDVILWLLYIQFLQGILTTFVMVVSLSLMTSLVILGDHNFTDWDTLSLLVSFTLFGMFCTILYIWARLTKDMRDFMRWLNGE